MHISNILIIDNANSHILFLKWILQNNNYMAYTANNIKEAEAFLKLYHLHLILLNPFLTDEDGNGLLPYLHNNNLLKKIPVIVIAPEQKKPVINNVLQYEVADYIIKPYNINNLINKIEINLKQGKNKSAK